MTSGVELSLLDRAIDTYVRANYDGEILGTTTSTTIDVDGSSGGGCDTCGYGGYSSVSVYLTLVTTVGHYSHFVDGESLGAVIQDMLRSVTE